MTDKIRLYRFPADHGLPIRQWNVLRFCFTSLGDATPHRSAPPLKQQQQQQQLIWSPLLVPYTPPQQTAWKRASAACHASYCLSCYFASGFKDAAVQHLLNKIRPISAGLEKLNLLTFLSRVKMISTELTFSAGQCNTFERSEVYFGVMLYHRLS